MKIIVSGKRLIYNTSRLLYISTSLMNSPIFSTIFGTRKLFSKKYTHAGSLVNTTLPACYIYHFTLQIYKSSAQNHFRTEDFCSIIIEAHL